MENNQKVDILQPSIDVLERRGVVFSFTDRLVSFEGRSKLKKKIAYDSGKQGIVKEDIIKTVIDPYNDYIREQTILEIQGEIAAEEKAAQEAKEMASKELTDLREQLDSQAADFAKETAEKEAARKKPLLQITAYFGLSLTVLVALVLVGLNFFNATYFLGQNLHWSVLLIFAMLFGASFVYFALSRNGKALKMLVWVIPFDLVIATLVKPFLGNTKTLQLFTENGFNWVGFVGLLLFLTVYGIQLFHAGNAVAKLLNPKQLKKEEEERHLENVLDSIQ